MAAPPDWLKQKRPFRPGGAAAGDKIKIACIGEAMIELSGLDFTSGSAALGIAGDTMNTAVYLCKTAGKTAEVSYLTSLGRDAVSARMIGVMNGYGLNTALIGRHPTRLPGIYAIELDAAGERSFRYWRNQSAARTLFSGTGADFADLAAFDLVYLSGITLAILPADVRRQLLAHLALIRGQGTVIVFDTNYRPALWADARTAAGCFDSVWRCVDLAMPSIEDLEAVYGPQSDGEYVQRLMQKGVQEVVLRKGETNLKLGTRTGVSEVELRAAGAVIDTTGAGDSFNAAYIASRLSGQSGEQAARDAHELALRVIALPGAIVAV